MWFQKISKPPPQRVTGNSKGRGSQSPKFLKESINLNWLQPKQLSVGEVWIFSGTNFTEGNKRMIGDTCHCEGYGFQTVWSRIG